MNPGLISPAEASILGIPAVIFALLIPVLGVAMFTFHFGKTYGPHGVSGA